MGTPYRRPLIWSTGIIGVFSSSCLPAIWTKRGLRMVFTVENRRTKMICMERSILHSSLPMKKRLAFACSSSNNLLVLEFVCQFFSLFSYFLYLFRHRVAGQDERDDESIWLSSSSNGKASPNRFSFSPPPALTSSSSSSSSCHLFQDICFYSDSCSNNTHTHIILSSKSNSLPIEQRMTIMFRN